jgi:hypothetical protein
MAENCHSSVDWSLQKYDSKIKPELLTKKVMWDKVSTELKSKGFNYAPDQVQGRCKSLARL